MTQPGSQVIMVRSTRNDEKHCWCFPIGAARRGGVAGPPFHWTVLQLCNVDELHQLAPLARGGVSLLLIRARLVPSRVYLKAKRDKLKRGFPKAIVLSIVAAKCNC